MKNTATDHMRHIKNAHCLQFVWWYGIDRWCESVCKCKFMLIQLNYTMPPNWCVYTVHSTKMCIKIDILCFVETNKKFYYKLLFINYEQKQYRLLLCTPMIHTIWSVNFFFSLLQWIFFSVILEAYSISAHIHYFK